MNRVVAWFSAGAPSAVAAKLAVAKYGDRVVIARNVIPSEHPDNDRFAADVAAWLGREIVTVASDRYADTWDVWEKRRFISSPQGALCTTELKKMPRQAFQRPDDIHVFGYTADKADADRAVRIREQNFEMTIETPLIDAGLERSDCLSLIERAGITLPALYALGFRNNNCMPCGKATSPTYWNRVRRHFPDRFDRMAALSRDLNVRLVRVNNERIFLDELDPAIGAGDEEPDISCSLLCAIAEGDMKDAAA